MSKLQKLFKFYRIYLTISIFSICLTLIQSSAISKQDKAVLFKYPNKITKNIHATFTQIMVLNSATSLSIEFWFRFDKNMENDIDPLVGLINTSESNKGLQYYFKKDFADNPNSIFMMSIISYPSTKFTDFFTWTKIRIHLDLSNIETLSTFEENLLLNDAIYDSSYPRTIATNAKIGEEFILTIGSSSLSVSLSEWYFLSLINSKHFLDLQSSNRSI